MTLLPKASRASSHRRGLFPLPAEEMTPIGQRVATLLRALRRYHDHRVIGAEHVPAEGPALIATNHSLATYDSFLLALAIFEQNGRIPCGLADDLLFDVPGLRQVAMGLGMVPASPANATRLLAAGRLVYLAPGGMHEALRARDERYRVRWGRRRGFVRLALRTGAPLVLAACPAADDIYTVYPSRLTDAVYRALKLPLPVARGLGPTILPRAVRLTHHVLPPIYPPPWDPRDEAEQVRELHQLVLSRMEEAMRAAEKGS